jgi:CelD/BcsL family acetyltransferase involved in cellulose biosynthesis
MKEFHTLAREVSRKTYQEKLLDMGLPSSQEFIKRLSELASAGLARGYILFHDEVPIAYLYCPIKDGILFYEYLGYDPEFSSWSPGTVLQFLVFEKLFNEGGFQMFDFTEGSAPHKKKFSTGSVQCADIYYFRATIKNFSILSIHFGLAVLSRNTAKILDLLKIKDLTKKFIRSHS